MGKLFATLSFFSAAVLIPLYATGANKNLSKKNRLRVFGIRIISFANIPKNDTRRMAFVFVADVLISLYILYFLSAEFRYLVRVRREHRISHHPSNYAILVQNIPTHYAKKDQLYQFFESLFPKGVQQVIPIPAGAKISKYRREYFDAVRQRQRAEAVLRNAQIDELTKQISESSFEAERGIFPESFAPASRLRMLLPALSNLFGRSSSSNSNETSLPFPGAPAPPLDLPGSPMQQPALQKKSSLTDKIKLPNALKNWRDPQQCINYYEGRERELYEKIEVLKTGGDVFDEASGTKSAIVVFTQKQHAVMAAQANFADSQLRWSVSQAPDPMAINWATFGASSRLVIPRRILVLGLVIALIIFWVIPTALIQSLANINSLSQTPAFSWLSFVDNLTPEFSGFIQGLVPAMVLELVMIVVPHIIRCLVRLKRIPSNIQVEQEVLQNMIAFLYFSHLIYVVLSGSLLEYSDEIIRNPSNIVRILARSIPQQGTFMMNVVLLTTVVQTPIGLLQPMRLLKRWVGMRRAWTARDKELVNASTSLADHFDSYSFGTIFAVLGIVYSTLTPLLLIFCTCFFLFTYTATKFKLVFTQTQPWEGFAALHPIALHGISTGLIVKQITMAGLMGLHKQATLATLEFILAALTSAVLIVHNQSVLPVIEHGALSDLAVFPADQFSNVTTQRNTSNAAQEVPNVYRHPSYGPLLEFPKDDAV